MANNSGAVTAYLKAVDSGFTSTISKAGSALTGLAKTAQGTGSLFSSLFSANIISGAVMSGISTLTSHIGGFIGELNSSQKAWSTFEGNMSAFGKSSKVIGEAKKEMQDYAAATVYSASDMANTYSQLSAVGVEDTGNLVKAFGGLAASAENPKQAMKSLSLQATQMASKPKIAWQDFKIMLEQAPAGLAKIAEEMGMSTSELVKNVQDGKVKTDEFFEAMKRAGNSDAFQKMATEFKTVDQAIDGTVESVSNKLGPTFEKFNKLGIETIVEIGNALDSINMDNVGAGVDRFIALLKTVKSVSVDVFSEINSVIVHVFRDIQVMAEDFVSSFADTGVFESAKAAIENVGNAIKNVSSAIAQSDALKMLGEHAGTVAKNIADVVSAIGELVSKIPTSVISAVVNALTGLGLAFLTLKGIVKGFNIAKGLTQALNPLNWFKKGMKDVVSAASEGKKIGGALKDTFKGVGDAVKSVLRGVGDFIKTTFKSLSEGISTIVKGIGEGLRSVLQGLSTVNPLTMLAFAAAIVAVGAALALIGTQGEGLSMILNAIGNVITGVLMAAFQGFAAVVTALGEVMMNVITVLTPVAEMIAGVWKAVIDGAVQIVGQIGPILSALGDLFNAAFSGLADLVSGALSGVADIASSVLGGLADVIGTTLGGLTDLVGTTFDGMADVIGTALSGISEIVSSVFSGVANVVKTFGEAIETTLSGVGSVVESFGNAVKSALDGVAGIIEAAGNAAKNAGAGFSSFADGVVKLSGADLLGVAAGLTAIAGSVAALVLASMGIGGATDGMIGMATALVQVTGGANNAQAALVNVQSTFSLVSSAATTASGVFYSFPNSLLSVGVAFNQMVSQSKNAMTSMVSAVQNASQQMAQLGLQMGQKTTQNLAQGLNSGKGNVISAINSIMSAAQSAANSGVSRFRSIGSMIGQGLAAGMQSAIGSVTAAANALVAQAERAARAKASIHSPSRLFRDRVGIFIGQGVAVGIERSQADVNAAMGDIFDNVTAFVRSNDSLLNGAFDYHTHATVVSENNSQMDELVGLLREVLNRDVVIEVNGKELARSVGDDISEYQSQRQRTRNLLRGART